MNHQTSPPHAGKDGVLGASDDARARTAAVSECNMACVTYYQRLELATVGSDVRNDCWMLSPLFQSIQRGEQHDRQQSISDGREQSISPIPGLGPGNQSPV